MSGINTYTVKVTAEVEAACHAAATALVEGALVAENQKRQNERKPERVQVLSVSCDRTPRR